MPDLTMPRVHLNGTSKGELLRQQLDAMRAIKAAIDALGEAAPNSRDYYVINNEAYTDARREHNRRVAALDNVRTELQQIAEAIDKQ